MVSPVYCFNFGYLLNNFYVYSSFDEGCVWNEISRAHKLIECFHSRGQHICKSIGTKGSVCIRKEFNSHRTGLGHQHGRRFIVLGHQYGRRDVMWKHSIKARFPLYSQVGFVSSPRRGQIGEEGGFFPVKRLVIELTHRQARFPQSKRVHLKLSRISESHKVKIKSKSKVT